MNKGMIVLISLLFSAFSIKMKNITELPPDLIETIITTIVAILSYFFGKKQANINNKNKFKE